MSATKSSTPLLSHLRRWVPMCLQTVAVARKNLLWGPGAWGVNFGLHKDFKFKERITASLGR